MRNFEKYIYHKTVTERKDGIFFCWYLIGKKNREGVHFHGHVPDKPFSLSNQFNFFASGIERHKKTPDREGHEPVKNCIVTGGDCYCDGSSLQASERLGFVNPNNDDEIIWSVLHEYYGYWIELEHA